MGHLGKYGFLKKTKKTYGMLIFIVSYGHTVKIGQMKFSLCDKYNSYVHFISNRYHGTINQLLCLELKVKPDFGLH